MGWIWETIILEPIYNALIVVMNTLTASDLGLAVIVMTLVLRVLLLPVSVKSLHTQAQQRSIQPEVNKIREQYKDDKQEQSKKLMELYKERNVNPFSGCLLLILQIPFILGLYRVIIMGVDVPSELLYSSIQFPTNINTLFLGVFDLTSASIWLALLAGAAQFLQMSLSPTLNDPNVDTTPTKDERPDQVIARQMRKSMKYLMPVMIAGFGLALPGAVTLYWITSALFMAAQEAIIRPSLNTPKTYEQHTQEHSTRISS